MKKCFVIQPFDNGQFDKRFDESLAPAIRAAKLEPYRVDRDSSAVIPIETIQAEIMASRLCLADITTDNPNVWYELGFAIARGKDVVLICSENRPTGFPFDVRHRTIVHYKSESRSDFNRLESEITSRLEALLTKELQLESVSHMSPVALVSGLESFEIALLAIVAQNYETGIPESRVSSEMVYAGFTAIATRLGLDGLIEHGMIEKERMSHDELYDGDGYLVFSATEKGLQWLRKNLDKLKLQTSQKENDVSPF